MPLPVFPKTKKWKSCNNVETSKEITIDEEEVDETGDAPTPTPPAAHKSSPNSRAKSPALVVKATAKKTEEKIGGKGGAAKRAAKPSAAKQQALKSQNLHKGVSKTTRSYYHQRACSTTTGKANNSRGIKSSIYNQNTTDTVDLITKKIRNGEVGKPKETRV